MLTVITVVRETSEHVAQIRQLTIDAFSSCDLGHNGEADLIDAIREQCDGVLSLVALDGVQVVGHIMFTPATIATDSTLVQGMALAPMAVLPQVQRTGIGSTLVNEGVRCVEASDAAFTLVAGHPTFYQQLGFLPAQQFSILHGFDGMPQDIFFIRINDEASLLSNGRAYYNPVFGAQHDAR